MEQISHEDQHRKFPHGTVVIDSDGQRLGRIRAVYDHFFLVGPEDARHTEFRVPPHAVASFDGERIMLTVNRDALTMVDDAEAASRRLHVDDE